MHKRKIKLDCFEHKHIYCFKLLCASIVYHLCTALWWQIERRGGPLTEAKICHSMKQEVDQKLFSHREIMLHFEQPYQNAFLTKQAK